MLFVRKQAVLACYGRKTKKCGRRKKRGAVYPMLLNDLILPPIYQLGMQLEEEHNYKTCGSTYSILPESGKGYYRVYGYMDCFAVVVYNISLKKSFVPSYEHPAFYTIGSYDNITAGFISRQPNTPSRILISYSRPKEVWKEVLYKGYSGKGVSISLSESYAKEIAGLFHMSMDELEKRCFCLDGSARIPEAELILKQLQFYTPLEQFAFHYYRSKLIELLTVLCQRYESVSPLPSTTALSVTAPSGTTLSGTISYGTIPCGTTPYSTTPATAFCRKEAENLSRVTEYINAHFAEPVNLRTLSATAFMGRTKLSQTFKQFYGITITQYIRQLRVEHAKSLLKNNRLSLGEIAGLVGYQSQGSFTELFKETTGLTPREYRNLFCMECLD